MAGYVSSLWGLFFSLKAKIKWQQNTIRKLWRSVRDWEGERMKNKYATSKNKIDGYLFCSHKKQFGWMYSAQHKQLYSIKNIDTIDKYEWMLY